MILTDAELQQLASRAAPNIRAMATELLTLRAAIRQLRDGAPIEDVRWDWGDPTAKLPFPNKPENIDPGVQLTFDETTSIRVAWNARGADVFVDDVLTARLEEGAMPGWSRGALVDSRLALRLTSRRLS